MPIPLSHIFYSLFFLVIFLIYFSLVLRRAGWRQRKWQIVFALSLLILIQLFFGDREFQHALKSYLAPSHSFQCEELKLPLPERTVFEGITDSCSPFYRTYSNENEFNAFYNEVLPILKNEGKISSFHALVNESSFLVYEGGKILKIQYKYLSNDYYRLKITYPYKENPTP
ncbi:hypothetical protein ACWKW1_02115 [Brevibacillus parabrevis]